MRTFFYFIAISLFVASGVFAQQKQATISFTTEKHDFGQIKEEDGKVTYAFEFTNTGSENLVLNTVKASCGCTTPDWSKEPVAPGKKGFVKATYDPTNRPGRFDKTITVTCNATNPTTILRINGEVTPRPKTVDDDFPKTMGDLKLKTNHISMVKVTNTATKTESTDIMNGSATETLTISFKDVPDYITIKAVPSTLKPGEKGKIEATFDANKKKDWGFVIERIQIVLNNDSDPRNKISVSATIEEDFSKLTEQQMKDAPKVEFENMTFNFGTINQGDVVDHTFKFKNLGKNDLVIRKTKASCGCTAIAPVNDVIKGGAEGEIKVTFNSRGKSGKQNKTITVITNDPHENNSSLTLRITGEVLVPEENK